MDLSQFVQRLRLVANELQANREAESVQIGREAMALVRLRVQNEKEDAEGNSFGKYSQALVPKQLFYGKSLSAAADNKVRKRGGRTSYEEFREDNNLETDAKDYTFSGEMWRDTGVFDVVNTDNVTEVSIGGTTNRSKTLIGYHTERDGNILELSDSEIGFVVDAHRERVLKVINKNLL